MKTLTNEWDDLGEWGPQLEQRRLCRLPPAGDGGWDHFYSNAERSGS